VKLVEIDVSQSAAAAPELGVKENREHGLMNARHSHFMLTPPARTRSITRFGVSVEKVAATIEVPSSTSAACAPKGNIAEGWGRRGRLEGGVRARQ
jgi:hypothetical protein